MNEASELFALVWVDSKVFYECSSEMEIEEKLLLLKDEKFVQVLRPTRTFIFGDEIT
jgi:hypothetical protein